MLIFDQLKKDDPQLRLLTVVVMTGMAILFAGLWYVQVISSRRYVENLREQSFRTVRVPAVRGRILDRNGLSLAENRPSYNVSLYLNELRDSFRREYTNHSLPDFASRYPDVKRIDRATRAMLEKQARYRVVSNTVHQLSLFLRQPLYVDERQFHLHYEQRLALPMPVLNDLSPAQIARFAEQPSSLPGADLEVLPARKYNYGPLAAHVLGYLTRDESSAEDEDAFYHYRLPDYRGVTGIEGAYDQLLRGKAGLKSVLVNNLGYRQMENVETLAEPGRNLVLTLDAYLQDVAEKALRDVSAEVRGAVVVMNPRNGDVLAMASAPAFDPNEFMPRIRPDLWAKLNDPSRLTMINRATYGMFAPGSIFKIVTSLAALDAGELHPEEKIENPGYFMLGRRRIDDLAEKGDYDFIRGFKRSSNTYFITHGLRPGVLQKMISIGARLHLGERTGVLPRQEVTGEFPTARQVAAGWHPGDTANLSIGQGYVAVTPIQMAVMTCAIANGGKVFWPRIVERVVAQDALNPQAPTAFPEGRVRDELGVSPSTLQLIRRAMLEDVEDPKEGTGRQAYVKDMQVCGKTGTAQVTMGRRVIDHVTWFVSFAPHDDPQYVVVVMVQSGASGGTTCAPVARRIYEAIQKRERPATPPAETLARTE